MRLMTEGFYLTDYIESVINFIETGECLPESSWKSEEALIKKIMDYCSYQQVIIVTEIKEYFVNNSPQLSINSNSVEQRTIDFLNHFDDEVVKKGGEKYDYVCDMRLIMNYILLGKDFSASVYSSKENYFEKLRLCSGEQQQAIILALKLYFAEKMAHSLSGYVISFFKKTPRDPVNLRLKEVLNVFDPKNQQAVVNELAKEKDMSDKKCYVM